MKTISFFVISLILSLITLASCQTPHQDSFKNNIKKEAEIMSNLMVNKKYDDFLKYMHPSLITMMGGKEKVLDIFKQGLPDGTTIKSVKISYPSDTVKVNNQIQCTLKEEIEMKVKGGKLIAISTLVGLSDDDGKTWYFLDANSKSLETLKTAFPNLSSRLIFVESTKPIFVSE